MSGKLRSLCPQKQQQMPYKYFNDFKVNYNDHLRFLTFLRAGTKRLRNLIFKKYLRYVLYERLGNIITIFIYKPFGTNI